MTHPRSFLRTVFHLTRFIRHLLPGIALSGAITAAAYGLQILEFDSLGRAWLEALVIAILLGTLVRSIWEPSSRWGPGIHFCAKTVLEIAVVLLGATISGSAIIAAGLPLILAIIVVVATAVPTSYMLGRLFRLPPRMAMLVACGNGICGNSAIAAVAPVIGAEADDVAASIAFTAVLGVAVVLGLPLIAIGLAMTPGDFGILAGLTVYAVPQVLAATAPISSVSAQVGTLVKLIRVLMLGPIVLALTALHQRGWFEVDAPTTPSSSLTPGAGKPGLAHLVPWFIIGFLVLIGCRSAGLVPNALIGPITALANILTIIAMAALGLTVDIRTVAKAGLKLTSVVTLSLLALGGLAMLAIRIVHLG